MKLPLEDRIGTAIPNNHPTKHWMGRNAAVLLTMCLEGKMGPQATRNDTAKKQDCDYQMLVGRSSTSRLPNNNLDANLKCGIFRCKSYTSDKSVIGLKHVPSLVPVVLSEPRPAKHGRKSAS